MVYGCRAASAAVHAASTRSRSSGWMAFAHPEPRTSSTDCPVRSRQKGMSSTIPSASVTHTMSVFASASAR